MNKFNFTRTTFLAAALALQLSILCFQSRGAAGDVDLLFDPGSGVNGTVNAIALQPDGKVIIGGQFSTLRGLARVNIARLNEDGSGDGSFDSGTNANGVVTSIALQSDGKVLFTVDGNARFQAARLNNDGTLDNSFSPQNGDAYAYGSQLSALVVQTNGNVVFGGFLRGEAFDDETQSFYFYERFRIYRVHGDGSYDNSFAYDNSLITIGASTLNVKALVLQPDGKLLVGGHGALVNGTAIQGIARLNVNGSADSTFNPGAGADGVTSIALQSDGKAVIGGFFSDVNGTNRNRIARLNGNGSLDTTFDPGTGADNAVFSVALQSSGKVLLAGYFTAINGTTRTKIAQLNADGSLDTSFGPGSGTDRIVFSVVVQPNGKPLLGGNFTSVNSTGRERMARLNTDGTIDASFDPGATINGRVVCLATQSDGRTFIGGTFTSVNGTIRNRIARLNLNGSVDVNFDPGTAIDPSVNPTVNALLVQPDGKLLVGIVAELTAFGTNYSGLIRLSTNGSIDSAFHVDAAIAGKDFHAIALLPDGGMLVGTGRTWSDNSNGIVRLNPGGSRDYSFNSDIAGAAGAVDSLVRIVVRQPDGKVLAGGHVVIDDPNVGEFHSHVLYRLNVDGSRDTNFQRLIGEEPDPTTLQAIALQPDGKVLVGGDFTVVKSANRNAIARLNADGTLDSTFNAGTAANGRVDTIALQPDGRILIGGAFTTFNGAIRNRIARLNADGSLDNGFIAGAGADAEVRSILLQPDGNILVGGDFTTINDATRPHVGRLYGDSSAPGLNIARSNTFVILSWPTNALNFQLQETTNLALANSWSQVAQPRVTNGVRISVAVPTNTVGSLFRLKSQ